MATTTQTVIIDFQADFSSVEGAIDTLEKAGKVDASLAAQFKKTNTEIKNQGQAFDKAAASAQKESQSFGKLQQLMAQFPKTGLQRYLLSVGNELAAAGVKSKDFFDKSKKGSDEAKKGFTSLRAELKAVKDAMQQAALTSGVLSEEYQRLKERAGELDDTIKDVNDDIANAGSDTRGIDNVIGSISALAGGYAAVQGAAALFGDESEDLQKALLKVNAAMAIAQGIQQVSTALTKQGSLTRLADTAATYAQVAAQKIYTFVTGRATAATLAFKVALAATGIGLVVVAVLALKDAFSDAEEETEDLTKALERLERANAGAVRGINRAREEAIALAEEQGKTASEVSKIGIDALKKEIDANRNLENELRKQGQLRQKNGKIDEELSKKINQTFEAGIDLQSQLRIAESSQRKQAADERKKASDDALAKAKEANEKAIEAAKKARAAGFADFKAGIELELLEVEKGGARELELRKKLLNAQLQIDLEGENLTINQKKLLIQTYFKSRKDIEAKFNKEIVAQAVEAEKNRLAATLTDLNLSEEEKLQIKIEFLQISAQEEIAAAEGNASKIKLINAELNAAIAAAKVESIKKSAEEEARLLAATGGTGRRALEAVAANEKMKSDVRINAIRQLAQVQTDAINREIAANRAANNVKGADNKALELEYEELLDKKAQATEDAEKKITDITESENKKRRESSLAYIQAAISGLQQISSIAESIQSNEQQAAQNAIDEQRRRVDELLEAGAITEREAERRNKKIEAEERAVKNRAAQQQKKLAVFNAFLAIPQAFIAGLTAPFPIGGPIYGAILAGLAAVQAGIVASRPVPKFAAGKKGSYEGPGIIGEAGAELLQRGDGSMHVALKPELVYLGAKDKVFTAGETRIMMPTVNKEAIGYKEKAEKFDYNKMAAAMRTKQQGSTVINIDKEFISESVANGLMKTKYFDRYYKSK